MRETLVIGGNEYRVACNMNALIGFLKERGTDDFAALSDLTQLKPTDMLPLMAACIREGERLDGRECKLTAEDIGAVADLSLLTAFMGVFGSSIAPDVAVEKK